MSAPMEGGCDCGHVRYRITAPPLIVHGCHCSRCQRQTGAAFAVNVLVEAARVELVAGDVVIMHAATPSGAGQKITRCPTCHVAVWSRYLLLPRGDHVLFVRAGTLDEPDRCPPDVHIHTAAKRQHVQLPRGVPAFDAFYDLRTLWPPPSLARYATLPKGSVERLRSTAQSNGKSAAALDQSSFSRASSASP